MKQILLLLLFCAAVSSQFVDPTCPSNGRFSQSIYFTEWSKLRIVLLLKGQIEVAMGANGTLPTLEVISNGPSQADAEAVQIAIDNSEGNMTATIGVNLPAPPVPPVDTEGPEEDPSSSDATVLRGSPWKTVAFGMAAAAGTQFMYSEGRWRAAPLAAMIPLMMGVDGQAVNASCIGARVILTLPPGVADDVSAEIGRTFNTVVNGKIEYTVGQLSPAQAGYGTCTVDGVLGNCVDTATCTKNKVAGQCPGPTNIQCCVDNWGSCCANGKRGTCSSTCAGGTRTPGLCPGPAAVQCCTTGSSPSCGSGGGSYTAPKARNSGVTFAPATGVYWPVRQGSAANRAPVCYFDTAGVARQSPTSPIATGYDCSVRRFLALRSGGARYHSGIDLYADTGTDVIAAEAGRIVNAYPFYENVCCVIQQTDSGIVINYGEISCNYVVKVGQRVAAGQKIGTVGHLACCHAMIHFETYTQGTTANIVSTPNSISSKLRNPTEYLLTLRENGL